MEKILLSALCFVSLNAAFIQVLPQDIALPVPDKTGGKPLMQALNERQTIRTYTADNLTIQQLSELLWAGWGIYVHLREKWSAR